MPAWLARVSLGAGAALLKKHLKEKGKELVGKARKKAIAKLSMQVAAKERLYRDKMGNLVRGKDRKKDIEKTHDTLGRKIHRGEERGKHKKYPERKKHKNFRDLSEKRAIKEKHDADRKEVFSLIRKGDKVRKIILKDKARKRGKERWAEHKEKKLKSEADRKEVFSLIRKGDKVRKIIVKAKKSKEHNVRKKQRQQDKKDAKKKDKQGD